MAEKNPTPARDAPAAPVFTKEKLLTFRRYAKRRDLLSVLLKEGRSYTTEEVDSLLETFMTQKKGTVN